MKGRIVIDGNAFYEIDDECMRKKKKEKSIDKQDKPDYDKLKKK